MKFAKLMEWADLGNLARIFFGAAEIDINVYDGKGRLYEEDELRFVEPLFENNNNSLEQFFDFIAELHEDPVLNMKVTITETQVILEYFYCQDKKKIFSRKPPLDPLDYAD